MARIPAVDSESRGFVVPGGAGTGLETPPTRGD